MSVVWVTDRPGTVQAGDPLTGPRVTSFWWEVLDQSDQPTGVVLDGVDRVVGGWQIGGGATGGRVDYNRDAEIRSSGSLSWAGLTPCDWTAFRLKPWITLAFPNGERAEWPLGVFLPSTPTTRWGESGATADVDLYDKLVVLRDRKITSFALDAGTVVTDMVRLLITGTGELNVAITDSTATLRVPRVWEPNTSLLRIVNDLLDSINYSAVWVDGGGWFRCEPYVRPQDRERAWDFRDDATSIYRPDLEHEQDFFDVPNIVTLITSATGDEAALSWTETNTDEASPTSVPRRGREIGLVETGVEAADIDTLIALTRRRLAEASQVGSVVTIDHAPIPLGLNDRVGFTRQPADLALDGVVQSMTVTCEPGALMRTRIREVAS